MPFIMTATSGQAQKTTAGSEEGLSFGHWTKVLPGAVQREVSKLQ